MSVCLSDDNFRYSLDVGSLCLYLHIGSSGQGQGHRGKNVENPYSRYVKLRSAITPRLCKTQNHEVFVWAGIFGYGETSGVAAIFVT